MERQKDKELVDKAKVLRQAARCLLEREGLLACLHGADRVEVVGSVATDLMTKRDIDISCCLKPLETRRLLEIGQRVIERFPVGRMTFIDPSVIPWHDYKFGLYCGIQLRIDTSAHWNVDIWGYGPQDFDRAIQNHNDLASRLSKIDRLTLLRLKASCDEQSHAVYTAALDYGVRTPTELKDHLRDGSGPTGGCT